MNRCIDAIRIKKMSRLTIEFNSTDSFRALVSYMSDFTKGDVIMVINRQEIKLLYEEANRGRVFGTMKYYPHQETRSRIVNNANLNNYFIFEFKLERLIQVLETMADKHNITLELRQRNDGIYILLFTADCSEKLVSKFNVDVPPRCNRINPPPISRLPMNFEGSDLGKLLKMAKLFSKVKDNLLVSVQHTTYHHIFKIKYSFDTGSKVCHQIKYRREDQVDIRSSDVTAVKPRLFAIFFKLGALKNVLCFVKHDSILLEAENCDEKSNIEIKVHLKGLSEVIY